MIWKGGRWIAAIVLSGAIHAGAAVAVLGNRDESPRIEGTAGLEIAVLGAFQDSLSAGEAVEATEPVDPVTATTDAVEPEQGEAVQPQSEELAPVQEPTTETAAVVAPQTVRLEIAEPLAAERPDHADPLESEPTEEAQVSIPTTRAPVETVEPEETVTVARVAPSEDAHDAEEASTVQSAEPVAAVRPVETARLAAEPVDTVEAVEPTPILPEDAPLPSARPEPVREASVKPDRPEPKAEPAREKPRRRKQSRAGNGGRQGADSHKGQTTGRQDGNARASGAGNRKGGSDGNAAVSNYPGKVAARLRRAVRGVSRAARRGAKRDVHVTFVVMASGGLGSVRLTQSSGSPELDQAALASVRRAAPFPPIPSGAGRSKWPFSVPLGLAR